MRLFRGMSDVDARHALTRRPPADVPHNLWSTRLIVALDRATIGAALVVNHHNVRQIGEIIRGEALAPRLDMIIVGELVRGVVDEERDVDLRWPFPGEGGTEITMVGVVYAPPIGDRRTRQAALESSLIRIGAVTLSDAQNLSEAMSRHVQG